MDYFSSASTITLFVMVVLSVYLIAAIWVFIYQFLLIKTATKQESSNLQKMLVENTQLDMTSKLYPCYKRNIHISSICKNFILKEHTIGLTIISIVSSTSPFIGLFGTVVSILDTFKSFKGQTTVTLNIIAPAISEALVATAAGIFVATFAYTFFQILKREIYKFDMVLQGLIELSMFPKDVKYNNEN